MASGDITFPEQSAAGLTVSLNTLADDAGRGSAQVTNSGDYPAALISVSILLGTGATADTVIDVYLLRDNGTIADDAWSGDAGLTVVNAPHLITIYNSTTGAANTVSKVFSTWALGPLGPTWGLAFVNRTGAAFQSTNDVDYQYYNPKVTP